MERGKNNPENGFEPAHSDTAALAHALALVAQHVNIPTDDHQAWLAVSENHGADSWACLAIEAASALGLYVKTSSQLTVANGPALARSTKGRWLLVTQKVGPRFRGFEIHPNRQVSRKWSAGDLERLLGDGEWMHLQSLFPLGHHRPSLKNHPWKRLRAFLGLDRADLWVIVVYAIVIGGMTLGTPIAVQSLVNTVAFGSVLQPLVVLSILLLLVLGFAGVLAVLEAYVIEVLQRKIFVRTAEDFGRRLPAVRHEVWDNNHGPELTNRFFDVLTIQKTLSVLLLDGLSLALQTILGMVLLGFYHPLLLAFDVVLFVLLIAVLALGRGAVATGYRESSAKYRTAAWLQDISHASHLFRTDSAQRYAAHRTQMLCHDYLAARKQHFRILLRQVTGGIGLQVFTMVALLSVGGFLVIGRQLTLGQLVAAELVIATVGASFVKLGKNLEKLYDLNVGVMKVTDVVEKPTVRVGGAALRGRGPMHISLREVACTRGALGLHNINLDLMPGDRLHLTGPAGSGKTTLLEVIAGLRLHHTGVVLVDGVDSRRVNLADFSSAVAITGPPAFVQASVIDNFKIAHAHLAEPALRNLLRVVALEEVVNRLPDGLNSQMLPNGAPFSDAHARRLALARALAAEPRLLILDSALDGLALPPETFEHLLDTIFNARAPWTVVVTSDSPEIAARCNRHVRLGNQTIEDLR